MGERRSVIQAVRTPLGFFVLVVLVAEILLASVALRASDALSRVIAYAMVLLIAALVSLVAYLAIRHPRALFSRAEPESSVSASVVYPPTQKDRYRALFDQFDGDEYLAYNAPFEVESSGTHVYQSALNVHKKRYEAGLQSRYLLFSDGPFERAKQFFVDVGRALGRPIENQIEIRQGAATDPAPGFTFFLGYKRRRPVIILYPRAVMDGGLPKAVIAIEGAEDLFQILYHYFQRQWKTSESG